MVASSGGVRARATQTNTQYPAVQSTRMVPTRIPKRVATPRPADDAPKRYSPLWSPLPPPPPPTLQSPLTVRRAVHVAVFPLKSVAVTVSSNSSEVAHETRPTAGVTARPSLSRRQLSEARSTTSATRSMSHWLSPIGRTVASRQTRSGGVTSTTITGGVEQVVVWPAASVAVNPTIVCGLVTCSQPKAVTLSSTLTVPQLSCDPRSIKATGSSVEGSRSDRGKVTTSVTQSATGGVASTT